MLRVTVLRVFWRPMAWLALCGALTALFPARTVAQTCPGDCNDDREVSTAELVLGVDIALGVAEVSACPAINTNDDPEVTIDELVTAIANALDRCGQGRPTPTATPTPPHAPVTPSPTSTGNLPPTAVDDGAATLVDEPVAIFVLANDSDPNADPLNVTTFTQPASGTVSFTDDVATYTPNGGFSGTDRFTYAITDGQGGTASASVTVVVNTLPPDPVTVAPPPANGVATIVADATSFLYTGADAVQFGVAPGTIEPIRAAVLRGKVMTRAGDPLSGVRITVLNHPELGFTATRADGMFDLAVNGGGTLTIDYEKTGFCPVQRTLNAPWQDYVMAPDVVMIGLDPLVTAVTLGNAGMQVAQGSKQSDASGARHATVLFPPGTTANLVMPDGSTEPVSALSVRATEFTVGANGPQAMPAELPPTSAYTYCVELSADEALNAGAMMVAFNQPVINYVENFLNFPIGTVVPVGFYDRQQAAWLPSPNGRVIKILGATGGLADVDTDGDNVADDGLGITSEERQHLATLYPVGQSLWRVPVPHFSVVDANWAFLPVDASTPGQSGAGLENDQPLQDACVSDGSILECENQVLGESLSIVGTPYSLNYRSDREPGRIASQTFTLTGATVPASLQGIELHITVGGRTLDQTFPPNPNQQFRFVWDRKDAYGRTLLGGQPLTGSIDYTYPVNYAASNAELAFGTPGGTVLLENPGRSESPFAVSQPFSTVIGEGLTDARVVGRGGWTLSVHHFFDPIARVVHYGDGRRGRADSLTKVIQTAVTGPKRPLTGSVGTGGLTVGPDGSIYFMRSANDSVTSFTLRRLAPDGTETIVGGGGNQGPPPFGDDGPAVGAFLFESPIALGPDGNIYVFTDGAIRRIGTDGIIRRVVGRYFPNFGSTACGGLGAGPVGVPATDTDLCIRNFTVGPDGSLYLTDAGPPAYARVLRVGSDGIITTFAGSSTQRCNTFTDHVCGDGGPAGAALFDSVGALAVAPDGSLYVADGGTRIRRIGTDGIINAFAGGFTTSFGGDGGPAINAAFNNPSSLAFGADGSLYVADTGNARIRRVGTDGIITTVAGSGAVAIKGDGGSALQAGLGNPESVVVAPDGTILVNTGAFNDIRTRRIGAALPGISATDITIASQDGAQLYEFDGSGRHLRTLDALTGATLLEFGYDADGLLTQVIEKTGGTDNVTTIQHDGSGNPTAIIGPFGQVTTLGVDANGFLASITNPAAESVGMISDANGLVSSYTTPRGKTSTFTYDSQGRLTLDAAPGGASQTLTRMTAADAFTVTRTTALGRTTTYQTENLTGNIQRRTVTAPDGSQQQSTETIDAGTTHVTASDDTTSDTSLGPDPRFGIESPVMGSHSLRFPSALQVDASTTRSAVLANAADPLSLVSLTDTATVDGRTFTNTYTAATRTHVRQTPAGRAVTYTVDDLGRLVQGQSDGLQPVHVTYDSRGRLASLAIGSAAIARTVSLAYNAQGFIETITDPIGRTAHFAYDAAGRITGKTLPNDRVVGLSYDPAGNLISLAPPGRPAHAFGYSDRNELTSIIPPAVPGTGPTTLAYDADGAVTNISRAGVQTVAISYDDAGRPVSRVLTTAGNPSTTDTFSYDAAGRLTNIVVGASAVSVGVAYDGPLLTGETWSGPVTGNVTRTFDTSLRMISQSVNGANTIPFAYDDNSSLTGAGDLAIARDPHHGLPIGTTLDVVSDSLEYNGFGEVTDYTASASGAPLFTRGYSRDRLGRIAQVVETVEGNTDTYGYTYDLLGQLTDVTKNGTPIETYTYDANGNRTNATIGGVTINATYDDQDRLIQYGNTTYTFNAAGDLVSKTAGAQTTTYHYDALGNLLGVITPNATAITYVVDGQRRRVGKRVNGTLVQAFLYGDSLRPVAELDGNGTLVSRFVYAGRHVPAYMIKGGVSHRIITDQLDSVRLVVDSATGAIVQRMDYDSFGNVLLDTNPGFQPFGFAGGLYDADTGLVRLGERDYDSTTGRFTAKDPLGFIGGDPNLYAYVRNNPVNLIDPTGAAKDPNVAAAEWVVDDITDVFEVDMVGQTLTPKQRKKLYDKTNAIELLDEARRIAREKKSGRVRGFSTAKGAVCGLLIGAAGVGLELYSDDALRWLNQKQIVSDTSLKNYEAFQTLRAGSEAQFEAANRPFAEAHPFIWGFLEAFINSPPSALY